MLSPFNLVEPGKFLRARFDANSENEALDYDVEEEDDNDYAENYFDNR